MPKETKGFAKKEKGWNTSVYLSVFQVFPEPIPEPPSRIGVPEFHLVLLNPCRKLFEIPRGKRLESILKPLLAHKLRGVLERKGLNQDLERSPTN